MATNVRAATANDEAAIVALLLKDAAERAQHDARLWPHTPDAMQRIAQAFATEARSEGSTRWLVAEANGAVEGVARFGVIPCPPIYHFAGSLAFILHDDTYVTSHASTNAWPALIAEAERIAAAMGAVIFLAACAPFQTAKQGALAAAGYDVVTHYLVKHDLRSAPSPASIRAATPADAPAIVAMGARSQECLRQANARMWTPHAEARTRFGLWMQVSLNMSDRSLFVATTEEAGLVIAQPPSAFHLPLATPSEHLGVIDDFWAAEFATSSATPHASALLAAAEQTFIERGRTSAMVICPAAWQAKQSILRANGYGGGNAWLLKS